MKRVFAVLVTSMVIAVAGLADDTAKTVSKKEVQILTQKASTPAEYNELAQYYRMQAEKLEADAKEHADLAKIYQARSTGAESKHPMNPDTAKHCQYFAASLGKAATEARALSEEYADMAKKLTK